MQRALSEQVGEYDNMNEINVIQQGSQEQVSGYLAVFCLYWHSVDILLS